MSEDKLKVLMLESGGWGGIHYYAHALCDALAEVPVNLLLLTNEQYELADQPQRFRRLQLLKRESYLRTVVKFVRLLLREKPDLLHVQSLISQRKDLLLLLLCRLLNVRVVLTVHNILPHEVRQLERLLYASYYRLSDALILHSGRNRSRLLEEVPDLDERRVRIIAHGNYAAFSKLELSRAQAREQLGLPADRRIALFFGSIRPYKGLDLLLQTIKPVRAVCGAAFFAVAGNVMRGEQTEYERQIDELGISTEDLNIRFDYLSMADSVAYVCAADLVVLPYREIYQSGVLLFAFSFGRPVLCTRVGSFLETVEEGKNGWLVEKEDVEGLQQRLIKLLQNPAQLDRAGAYARQQAEQRYHWQGIAHQTAELYAEVERGT